MDENNRCQCVPACPQCPEGQLVVPESCQCVCPSCPDGRASLMDENNRCQCVCPSCPEGQVLESRGNDCLCTCPDCPYGKVRTGGGAGGCECGCPPCPTGQVRSKHSSRAHPCQCSCPTCPAGTYLINPNTCLCCPRCGRTERRSGRQSCDCECAYKFCLSGSVLNEDTCLCDRECVPRPCPSTFQTFNTKTCRCECMYESLSTDQDVTRQSRKNSRGRGKRRARSRRSHKSRSTSRTKSTPRGVANASGFPNCPPQQNFDLNMCDCI